MSIPGEPSAGWKEVRQAGSRLADRTMSLQDGNPGNAATGAIINLPDLFAGGVFRPGRHLDCDSWPDHPLPERLVPVLRRPGLATATGSGLTAD